MLRLKINYVFSIFILLLSSCVENVLNIPDFKSLHWEKMRIRYWIVLSEGELLECSFYLNDDAKIRKGIKMLCIQEEKWNSVPSPSQMIWMLENDSEWRVSVVFEDRLSFTCSENLGRSYTVDMCNDDFYKWLREKCLEDAKRRFSDIAIESIMLRTNLVINDSTYTPYRLDRPISEDLKAYVISEKDMFRKYKDDGSWEFPPSLKNERTGQP